MNAHSAYRSFINDINSYEWIQFLEDLANYIKDSNELINYLNLFPISEFTEEEFGSELRETLINELHDLHNSDLWLNTDFFNNKNNLYQQILISSRNIFSSILSGYTSSEYFHSNIVLEDDDSFYKNIPFDHVKNIEIEIKKSEFEFAKTSQIFSKLEKLIPLWKYDHGFPDSKPNKKTGQVNKLTELLIFQSIDLIDISIYKLIIAQPELLKTLDWRIFEELLADILKTFNYEIELTQPTKDGGIDIIAITRNSDFGAHKYLLQAKRYSHSIGIEPVQRLLFHQRDVNASKVCLATTANFTKGAWGLSKKYAWQLDLKNFVGVLSWIKKAYEIKSQKKDNTR